MNPQILNPTVTVDSTLQFSNDYWWVTLIKAAFIAVFLIVSVVLALWVERRGLGRLQTRPGPNVHGPLGLFQALADAVKLLTKEDIWKNGVDKLVWVLAPTVAAASAFMVYAVIPFGPTVSIFGYQTPLQLTDSHVAVLFVLAISSVGIYGIILGGWSSHSKLPLIGATRSAAQVISYELAMGMSMVSVFIVAGSMSTSDIVASQTPVWWAVTLFPAFCVYVISMIGEVNRLPFDLPECEGEIVAGHMVEYSSMKFAWFFLAEYINMFNVSGVCVTLFLGGWRFPYGDVILGGMLNQGFFPVIWFVLKVWALVWFMMWVRGTLLRVRYDQLMDLGWKILLPVALSWTVVVAILQVLNNYRLGSNYTRIAIMVGYFLFVLITLWVVGARADRREQARLDARKALLEGEFDAFAGGYPVPPLPGQELPPSPRRLAAQAASVVESPEPAPTSSATDEKEGE